jgi:hypothetical protein
MNCGGQKSMGELASAYCNECMAAVAGAEAEAQASNTDPFAARREALATRAHTANRNFIDPRAVGADRKTQWLYGNRPEANPDAGKA